VEHLQVKKFDTHSILLAYSFAICFSKSDSYI